MKKFSTGKDLKIGQKPEIKNEKSEADDIYYSILELADDFLKATSNTSVLPWGHNFDANMVKVTGKDLFAQALLEFLSNDETLEKLKKVISKKVEESEINEELKPHADKISKLLDIYGDDTDKLNIVINEHMCKIKNAKNSYDRHLVAEKMIYNPSYSKYSKSQLKSISKLFLDKSKELGYGTKEN